MKNLTRFELTMIILAVLVAFAGGGAWYYFSSELQTLHDNDLQTTYTQFVNDTQKQPYLPVPSNVKLLQENNDLLVSYLTPLEKSKLKPEGNLLGRIQNLDTASWKNDLDTRIRKLNAAAKTHNVQVPGNFYYGFSRFLSQNPDDSKTGVLDKQLLGIETVATILIQNNVMSILEMRRSYEEDEATGIPGTPPPSFRSGGGDRAALPTRATTVQNGLYTVYPLQTVFETTTDHLRQILNDLQASPYIFIIRKMEVHNSRTDSPKISDLDHLAGADASNNGAPVVKGPQFLFGAETLEVTLRFDLVEWNGLPDSPVKTPAAVANP